MTWIFTPRRYWLYEVSSLLSYNYVGIRGGQVPQVSHCGAPHEHRLGVGSVEDRLLLLGFGIAGLILQTVNNLSSGKFFLLFSPIFMM